MKERISAAVKRLLQEIAESPSLTQASRKRVDDWLRVEVSPIEDALCDLLAIGSEAGINPMEVFRDLWAGIEVPVSVPDVNPGFFRSVPLPSQLAIEHLQAALNETQTLIAAINRDMRKAVGYPLHHFIQANNFSGVVSNMLTDALDRLSPYKHNHEQRYPDLKNPEKGIGLEMKAANKAGKGGESHNGHEGWHLIACFDHDYEEGNVHFVHVEIAELIGHQEEPDGDWHYCGSKISDEGSQRTETYYTQKRHVEG